MERAAVAALDQEHEVVPLERPKGGRSRRVPLANRVLPIVRDLAHGKAPEELLLTTTRDAMLHRSAVLRTLDWETTGRGHRLHDLRHTAACLWLARRVDLATVQARCGRESAATTNRYLHFLGTGADVAGLDRLNDGRGNLGEPTTRKTPLRQRRNPARPERLPWSSGVYVCGARGWS
ncbi:tyrosine-type recombinase/integrase [Promicromonospora sp. AC04]|uniref:tyrosine-type recombinase/integrase n=1 Tax=Promicromonospora sp. AC04 TaxID=2135723 RepID=UPI001E2B7D76|nr:tyrosine-type recombinase/integrase [Promicromonospora sp. AC04]